jgi:hypothetical protein
MAGLAHDAAHFFKFLFIIVLYTLVMTLFVRRYIVYRILPPLITDRPYHTELLIRNAIPKRRDCHSTFRTFRTLPDDLCWFLCPPCFDTACLAMAAMALPTQSACI